VYYQYEMPRRYEQKKRALLQQETRRRILDAVVELHETVGPARTSVSAVAERAGVERPTVYRHFANEPAMLAACSAHFRARHPRPDAASWSRIRNPEERLRVALESLYRHYEETEAMTANVLRDAAVIPALAELVAPTSEQMSALPDLLLRGWKARGPRRRRLRAALAHAAAFATWRSLVAEQGLDRDDAVSLMVALARSA
jgi:AcrR family transcriptional regulator